VLFKRILYFFSISLVLASCSTKKNAAVNRAYHNLTARYNGYYYSTVNMNEGIYKTEKGNKDNYEKILPIYIYPSPEKAKSTFPDFDKAIKKSSLCIQKHAIKDKKGNEIPSSGKWIDNNWINIGISHFYKREFFSAIETFEYVIRTYTKSDDKYMAMVWLVKANNEIGAVSSSEAVLSLLKNEKKLKPTIKSEVSVLFADYYMRRGQNTEAIAKLMEATRNTSLFYGLPKSRRARYSFIIAQLSEKQNDSRRAVQFYERTIKLKPNYEMIFYSKIKIARLLDVKRNNTEKTKKNLLKMAKEFKNSDYYDVIYYTLGEIEEKENNRSRALDYYKMSVRKSINNPNQKALSYLKLGEINFEVTNYQAAESYYDSTIVTLPKDHPDYNAIVARKKTLETLVGYIKTINREDSLQRIAKMDDNERKKYIDRLIVAYEKEQVRLAREKEAALLAAQTNTLQTNTAPIPGFGGNLAAFYFYNPTTVAFGIGDFNKKWGNRKLEDNWRRSNKSIVIEEAEEAKKDSLLAKSDTSRVPEKTQEFYMKNLPLTDSLVRKSNSRIIKSYYLMGALYKEELDNPKKAIATFEELNKRFPENRYLLNTYYTMYRIYLAQKNTAKADFYKNKILDEFPESEFAALIRDPAYAQERNAKKSEVESYYVTVFEAYQTHNYSESYTLAKGGISKFGKTDYLPKFEFIRSMSLGKLKGVDTLEANLKVLVAKYPNSEVTPLSEDILQAIKKQKNPAPIQTVNEEKAKIKADSFLVNVNGTHFILAITADVTKIAEGLKTNIANFNSIFYSDLTFELSSNLFGTGKQMVLLKSFNSAKDALAYYDNLMADKDIFKGDIKKDAIDVFAILSDNLPILYKSKGIEGYKSFFQENYIKMNLKK
jgi:tetratricopeptide (TPR) repeat protein